MSRGSSDMPIEMKYKLYEKSVQNHEADIDFVNKEYKRVYNKAPLSFREDFGGTGAMACDWVKQSGDHKAWAIDLDPEPQAYGKERHFTRLKNDQEQRMTYILGNVLDEYDFKSDIIVAFNFSYFIFKKRAQLLEYFKRARQSLNPQGAFFVDIFGGTECFQELVEETEFKKHSYFWDCDHYNPLTNEVQYYIHFEKDGVRYDRAFSYDWRMWTVAEIVELMQEAGFPKVETYWEGEDEDGDGDGEFYLSSKEENCESWVTYIMGSL